MFGASTALVVAFGTLTLVLHDARFIQWKPTIFLWALALAFLVSAFIGQQAAGAARDAAGLGRGAAASAATG